ncbi:glycosyltransferase [Polynucleobacter sp. MWH-CaK5]|uniref:glycosyltransferase n=1 Tax=Polynucleobacter sp. MWH-CaK5 TaxID=2689107 RepID=UPI001BFE93E3|nr:glycosyltransferase [Polynucleobacter sp. MWH-CaK5]QWD89161.1 glycosyltransferase [Polynucleobacter sp. MWH-CaK5]
MSDKVNHFAPVAVFVYNRLQNTIEVIEALRKNRLAMQTEVYFFSDGPRHKKDESSVQEVRNYLRSVNGFKKIHLVEREQNYYIEKNIILGVTYVINKHGSIIVLEDDGVTSEDFLEFMNGALDFYKTFKKVMHVATFTFINMPNGFNKTFFWRYTENTGGGWATWKDRWAKFEYFQTKEQALSSMSETEKDWVEMSGEYKCLDLLRLQPIPWDLCWYISVAKNQGLAVQAPWALTVNNGLYNGTHFNFFNRLLGRSPFETNLSAPRKIIFSEDVVEDKYALGQLIKFYKEMQSNKRAKAIHFLLRILIYLKVTKIVKFILKIYRGSVS